MAWKQQREGYAIRHRLLGSDLSVLAYGGSHVVGYGSGGYARRQGHRTFELFDGARSLGTRPNLKTAKAHAERRAAKEES